MTFPSPPQPTTPTGRSIGDEKRLIHVLKRQDLAGRRHME
jgi:hypothetical protein